MNIHDILDEPLYFKDSERDAPERSLTYNVREYLAFGDLKGLILFLPTQDQVETLQGYLLILGEAADIRKGDLPLTYYLRDNT